MNSIDFPIELENKITVKIQMPNPFFKKIICVANCKYSR
jgi:hypothetical protein